MAERERNYYMVRAMGSREEEIDLFLSKGVVAVGWSRVNFASTPESKREELLKEVRKCESGRPARTIGRKEGEVKRFLSIRPGDIVVVPRPGCISVAEVTGERIYDPSAIALDLANQIRVKFFEKKSEVLTIPRADLTDKFQRTLGARGFCVLNLNAYKDEIDKLLTGKTAANRWSDEEAERCKAFKETLLKRIQKGKTYIKAHGAGLEQLVKELLEIEGYQVRILSKRNSKGIGDIDLLGTKTDTFSSTTLLVQAKHHEGESGAFGVKQLEEAVRQLNEKTSTYEDSVCWLITTADSITQEAKERAEIAGISTMVGQEFADWLYDRIGKLSNETRRKLGISTVPWLT